jgi:iron complex outermembrane recepter protein
LSHRAPALEELYFFGPHAGNLTFEIGNANLAMERNTGLDASLRRQSARLRFEGNVFYYRISDFVYLAPTGRIREGFVEANYAQADTRYRGAEARLDAAVRPDLWLNVSIDSVSARIRETNTPLPRIPPIRGRIGFDVRLNRLSMKPELVLARPQNSVFATETRTAGYAVTNLNSTYTIAGAHSVQIFYFTLFNATDRLYRNHLSFIKNIAPEIGRGFRIGYTIRFF